MFCSLHDFISRALSFNLCHCCLKYRRLVTFNLTLIPMMRLFDIPKLSRNTKGYLMSRKAERLEK